MSNAKPRERAWIRTDRTAVAGHLKPRPIASRALTFAEAESGEEVYHDGEWPKDGAFIFVDDIGRETRGHRALGLETGEWLERYVSDSAGQGEYRVGLREGT